MKDNEVIEYLETAPLENLEKVFSVLAERVHKHRLAHQGCVPLAIFENCLGMSGMAVSVQIVNQVIAGGLNIGFMLKLREADEVGWQNLYHNTCTVGRLGDTPTSALGRNQEETFGYIPKNDELEFLGCVIDDEPERRISCLTVMYLRKIQLKDANSFIGRWSFFTNQQILNHDPRIVNYDCTKIEWVLDKNCLVFADIRP